MSQNDAVQDPDTNSQSEDATANTVGTDDVRTKWWLGAFYTITSSFANALCSVIIKKMSSTSVLIAACRVGGQYLFLMPYVAIVRYNEIIPVAEMHLMWLVLGRVFFGIAGLNCYFVAINRLPVGDASTLMFSSSIVLSVLCWLFLGENMSGFDMLMLVTSMAGCICVARPTLLLSQLHPIADIPLMDPGEGSLEMTPLITARDLDTPEKLHDVRVGFAAGFGAMVCVGLAYTFVRAIGTRMHFTVTLFYYTTFGILTMWPYLYFSGTYEAPNRYPDLPLLGVLVMFGFTSQGLRTLALQHETAYMVSVYSSTQLLFAFLLDYFIFGVSAATTSIAGSVLIVISVCAAGYQKNKKTS